MVDLPLASAFGGIGSFQNNDYFFSIDDDYVPICPHLSSRFTVKLKVSVTWPTFSDHKTSTISGTCSLRVGLHAFIWLRPKIVHQPKYEYLRDCISEIRASISLASGRERRQGHLCKASIVWFSLMSSPEPRGKLTSSSMSSAKSLVRACSSEVKRTTGLRTRFNGRR